MPAAPPLWPTGLNATQRRQLAAAPLLVRAWPHGPRDGAIIQNDYYHVYTTIQNPLQRRLIIRVLDAAYARFLRLVPDARPPRPLVGYVFRNRRQWARFTRKTTGGMASLYLRIRAGGYERTGVFVLWRTTVPEALSVLAHEAWHQLSFTALKNHLPAWLDEGLATQNEAMQWRDGRPRFTPWRNQPRWLALRFAMANRRLLPLKELVVTQAGDVIVQSSTDIQTYYAEVWSLMLYLEHSRYRGDLLGLLEAARRGKLTAFLDHTGLTPRQIADESVRWNSLAGIILLRVFFSEHISRMQRRYLAFIRRLTRSWPPVMESLTVGPGGGNPACPGAAPGLERRRGAMFRVTGIKSLSG